MATFGVTASDLVAMFHGLDQTGLASAIPVWIEDAGAEVSSELRMEGVEADTVASGTDLHRLCRSAVILFVAAQIARSTTYQDADIARVYSSDAAAKMLKIHTHIEALRSTSERAADGGGRGTFRGGSAFGGQSSSSGSRAGGFWRRGRGI